VLKKQRRGPSFFPGTRLEKLKAFSRIGKICTFALQNVSTPERGGVFILVKTTQPTGGAHQEIFQRISGYPTHR
jgi:hypothetical protein